MINKFLCCISAIIISSLYLSAQITVGEFGKGLMVAAQDSSYDMKFNFRFQTLYTGAWRQREGESSYGGADHSILVRRMRLKFGGYALSPKLEYKLELALSNRDLSGGNTSPFRNAPNAVLDAFLEWNFYKGFSVIFGQKKLPGNRERVISSGDLQLVDRSLLNSRYTIDRDVGIHLAHQHKIGKTFTIREVMAVTQGEGRNVTIGASNGLDYTLRAELLPFGTFASKGDYTGAELVREPKPKLSIGVTLDFNKNAVRTRGQLGSFIENSAGDLIGRDLNSFFIDAVYKHEGFSFWLEYVEKSTADDDPFVYDTDGSLITNYFTGSGLNVMTGFCFPTNLEMSLRYTSIHPDQGVGQIEKEYTVGLSKYLIKHKLKVQTDISYRSTQSVDNRIIYRLQTEIQF